MVRRRRGFILLSTLAVLCLGAVACQDGGDAPVIAATTTSLPVTGTAKELAGLIGTSPLVALPAELQARIDEKDPAVGADAPAAARPYDAVVIAALAAEIARTDSPSRIAARVEGVTRDGQRCNDFHGCRTFTDVGVDIDYDGPSGEIDLLSDGQSGDGTFAIMQVSESGALEQVSAGSADVPPPAESTGVPDPAAGPRADGRLVIGAVLPSAGPQERVGAAALAGIRVAVDEVNSFGGALGRPVELVWGDAGDGSEAQLDSAAGVVLNAGADVVIGGLDASDTDRLVERIVGAGVVMLSPGLPSTADSTLGRSGLFFRLTPPAAVQGAVLAAATADDGHTSAALIVSADAVGLAMGNSFQTAFEGLDSTVAGIVSVGSGQPVAPGVDQALALGAEALVVMADTTTAGAVLAELSRRGQGPAVIPTYVANIGSALLLAAE